MFDSESIVLQLKQPWSPMSGVQLELPHDLLLLHLYGDVALCCMDVKLVISSIRSLALHRRMHPLDPTDVGSNLAIVLLALHSGSNPSKDMRSNL
jgi:hypothetical protein